jgi:hypothetical protein
MGANCSRYSATRGITGFIGGGSSARASTAVAVLSLAAVLWAPRTLTCLDHQDVAEALGTAQNPASLAQAIWMRGDRRLVYVHEADRNVVGRSFVVTCHIAASDLRVREMHTIMNALRTDVSADCAVTYQAPVEGISASVCGDDVAQSTIICRSREAGDPASVSWMR